MYIVAMVVIYNTRSTDTSPRTYMYIVIKNEPKCCFGPHMFHVTCNEFMGCANYGKNLTLHHSPDPLMAIFNMFTRPFISYPTP